MKLRTPHGFALVRILGYGDANGQITVTIEYGRVKGVDGIPVDAYLEARNNDAESIADRS